MPSSPSQEQARGGRFFRGLDILTIYWATGDLPEECRFLLNTQLMLWKKEKEPTSKQFDDDQWIRSTSQKTASCMISTRSIPRKFGPLRWVTTSGAQ